MTQQQKHAIIGTAGHVDHGKTSLIKALTGVDTDRLKEEKSRGITIELGFAYMDLPNGKKAGIIDVPGHEKFIHHMLAGAGGVDLALLIIAADEGIMPQTEEHMAILSLLGIKQGIVVMTKCDMVDDEWAEMMSGEIAEKLGGTFLEDAPIMRVSAYTGAGIEQLKEAIYDMVESADSKNTDIPFRIPVDRVFSVDGFGTVITGTLIEGVAREGDSVSVYPKKLSAKVRGLQVHSKSVKEAYPGQRVAVNLGGVHKSDIERGDIIAAEGTMDTSFMLDVELSSTKLDTHIIKNGSRLHFYHGSREILCKVVLLNADEISKGETCMAQIRLEEPVSLKSGDRFIVRFYSPLETVGGGIVIDANPKKHRRNDEKVIAEMQQKKSGTIQNQIAYAIKEHSSAFIEIGKIKTRMAINDADFEKKIENLEKYGEIVKITSKIYLHKSYIEDINEKCVALLKAHHKDFPLQEGVKREEVASKLLRYADVSVANSVLGKVTELGQIKNQGGILSLQDFTVSVSGGDSVLLKKLEDEYKTMGLAPENTDKVLAAMGKRDQVKEVYNALIKSKTLVRVDAQITIHANYHNEILRLLREHFAKNEQITLAEFRDLIGTSRKYAVAILEQLDSQGVTKKVGDARIKGIKIGG